MIRYIPKSKIRNKQSIILILIFLSSCTHTSSFGDYKCTKDCSGHKAGYNWAKDKNIKSSKGCGGKSKSFIEGCLQYIKDIN